MTVPITKISWETYGGATFAQYDRGVAGWVIEISITGRERPSMWDRSPSNIRDWVVQDENNEIVASGHADGLRNAKRAALQGLNDYLAKAAGALK